MATSIKMDAFRQLLSLKTTLSSSLAMCRSACNQVFNHGGALRPAGILPSLHSTNLISRSHLHTSCSKGYLKKPLENYHESLIKYKVRFVPTIDNRLLQGKLSRALQHDFLQKHKPPPKVVIHACKRNIRGSPKRMNLLAKLIRRLPIDDAILQMQFSPRKLSRPILRTLLQAKEDAVVNHNITDSTQLFVEESTVGRSTVIKGIRYHAKGRAGVQRTYFCHYFLKVKEGKPPKKPKIPLEHRKGHTKWMVTNMPPPKIINGL